MRKILLATFCVLTLTFMFGDAKIASAGQSWVPGSICKHRENRYSSVWYSHHHIFNQSTSYTRGIYCPIIKTSASWTSNDNWAYVLNRHYTEEVVCQLQDYPKNSDSYWFTTDQSNGSSSSPQLLTFNHPSAHTDGFRGLFCWLPRIYSGNKSGLYMYHYEE